MNAPAKPADAATKASRFSRLAPTSAWLVADQAMVSLANFAAPVLVGRFVGREQLGYYWLAYSVYLFAMGLAKALVWSPYTKHLPHVDAGERPAYTGSVTAHLAAFAASTAALVAVGGLGAVAAGATDLGWLLAIAGPCVAAMLFREHVRRLCFARLEAFEALAFDAIVCLAQVAGLAWLATTDRLGGVSALAAMAGAALLSFGWLVWRRDRWTLSNAQVWPDWLTNWSISKWLAGGASAVLLGNLGYRWMLPIVASLAELGRLATAQSVIQIANPLTIGVANYLGPHSANVFRDEGRAGLIGHTVRITLAMAVGVTVFLALLAVAGPWVTRLLFGDASVGVTAWLLVVIGAGTFSELLLVPIEFASLSLGRGRLLFSTATTRLAINLGLGFPLVAAVGPIGIGWGMMAGSVVAGVWQWASLLRDHGDSAEAASPAPRATRQSDDQPLATVRV